MGLLMKDLVSINYYKGYDAPSPNGKKVFVYIADLSPSNGVVEIEAWKLSRTTSQPSWVKLPRGTVPESMDSLLNKMITRTELLSSGGTHCPVDPAVGAPSYPPAAVPTPYVIPERVSSAQKEKAERNKGKTVLPANAHSKTCVQCGGANKEVVMTQFSTFWCPKCEKE